MLKIEVKNLIPTPKCFPLQFDKIILKFAFKKINQG